MEQASEKLSILKTLLGAFLIPWWNALTFVRSLAIPAVGMLIVFTTLQAMPEDLPMSGVGFGLMAAASALFAVLFAVTCHRLVLLSQQSKHEAFEFGAYRRLIKFFLWVVGLAIIEGILSIPFTRLMGWFINTYLMDTITNNNATVDEISTPVRWLLTLSTLPALYVVARFSLVFPSIAIDNPLSMSKAWALTKGNGWKMAAIVFLFPWILFHLIALVPTTVLGEWACFATIPFVALVFVVEISALSLTFRQLSQAADEPNQQVKPTP